jgi:hypothetical protein
MEEGKKAKKEYMAMMKRKNIDEGGGLGGLKDTNLKKEEDDGVLAGAEGLIAKVAYPMRTQNHCCVRSKVQEVDKLYNAIRSTVKDTNLVILRMVMENPKLFKGEIVKQRSHTGNEPNTEVNKHSINPAL